MANNREQQAPGLPEARRGITHTSPPESVEMNKYHLMLAIKRIQDRPKGPSIEQVGIPLVFAIGLLLTLLPADFKSYWGVSAATWQALAIMAFLLSAALFFYLLGRWLWCAWRYPPKREDEYYADILNEMAADSATIEAIDEQARRTPQTHDRA